MKVNVIVRLEYELAYYDFAVHALTITPRGHPLLKKRDYVENKAKLFFLWEMHVVIRRDATYSPILTVQSGNNEILVNLF